MREKIEIEKRKEQILYKEFVESISIMTTLQFARVGNELNFKIASQARFIAWWKWTTGVSVFVLGTFSIIRWKYGTSR